MAFCPGCRKDTLFVEAGGMRKCSVCGLQFEVSEPMPPEPPVVVSEFMDVVKVLLRVVLIIGAIIVIGFGVLYAGCALSMGRM
jgi:hypothetical protein